uniref:Uncharacterized protein n=1 Tax=Nymphaea colorata TaxID=210225 RepID=A0A5K0XLD2_9MAGN
MWKVTLTSIHLPAFVTRRAVFLEIKMIGVVVVRLCHRFIFTESSFLITTSVEKDAGIAAFHGSFADHLGCRWEIFSF